MPAQQLLLSWKDHNGSLVSVFDNLLRKNKLVDCTLAAEGQYLKAHKVVLSACSSYFELLFSQESEKNPIVILKDVKFQELKAAVNFMYKGEVEVCEDRLTAFLEVADSLQIKGLGSDGKPTPSNARASSTRNINSSAYPPNQELRKSVRSIKESRSATVDQRTSKVENEVCSRRQSSHESPQLSPVRDMVGSYGIPSTSTEALRQQLENSDQELGSHDSPVSPLVSFPPPVEVPTADNAPVVKTEPVGESYSLEKVGGEVRDDDDVAMMDDDGWDEPKDEDTTEELSGQDGAGYQSQMKTQENVECAVVVSTGRHTSSEDASWLQPEENMRDYSSVYVKQEPGTSTAWEETQHFMDTQSGPQSAASADPADGAAVMDSRRFYAGGEMCVRDTADALPLRGASASGAGVSPCAPPTPREGKEQRCAQAEPSAASAASSPAQRRSTPDALPAAPLHSGRGRKRARADEERPKSMKQRTVKGNVSKTIGADEGCLRDGAGGIVSGGEGSVSDLFACPELSAEIVSSENLKSHMFSSGHTLKCRECGYVAPNWWKYSYHMRTHTGEKPYKCIHCEFPFALLSHLKRHLSALTSTAAGEKGADVSVGRETFRCSVCLATFPGSTCLKAHMRLRHHQ